MDAKIFWNRVKQLIKKNKTTQKDLAEFIDLPVRTLENWIYRNSFPLFPDGCGIAKFFNVSVDYLLTGKAEKSRTKIGSISSLLKLADEKLKKL